MAESTISHRNFRKPSTLGEAFDILHEEKLIDSTLAAKMVKMAGFRNIIAHDYAKINYDKVYKILHEDLKDVEEFIVKVKPK